MGDLILSIEEFAKLTNRSVRTIKNILWSDRRESLPPARKIGRKTFFIRSDVESWLLSQPIINVPQKKKGRRRKVAQVNQAND